MPTYRGIKFTVVSQLEFRMHPEFAHPENSQFPTRSPEFGQSSVPEQVDWSPPSTASESKADSVPGRQSTMSVYIPSVPGSRFWLRYSMDDEAIRTSLWYYFKLFMNGRHIASWGTNSRTDPSGQVMRGLFEPSDKWNYKYEGTVFKNMGTEMRPFFFANDEQVRSAANDGGLIEVLVFRAKGRKRKMPEPTDFKNQEKYGIVMPSTGLFEPPQDAKYYDYHLKDPRNSPFGTFRFHYRSWDSLASLQLIPSNHPRKLLPPSASMLSLNGLSREIQAQLQETESDDDEDEDPDEVISPAKNSVRSFELETPWLTTVFDDTPDEAAKNPEQRNAIIVPCQVNHFYPTRTESLPKGKSTLAMVDKSISPGGSYPRYTQRPLPDIPVRNSSLRHSRSSHSRKSSSTSNTPSITPSLLPYIERDTISPEPEFGVASAITVTRHSSPILEDDDIDHLDVLQENEDDSFPESLPELTSPSKTAGNIPGTISPPPLFSSLFNVTRRKNRESLPETPPKIANQASDFYSPLAQAVNRQNIIDNMTALSITEAEWMCRTPSPIKDHPSIQHQENQSPPTLNAFSGSETGSILSKSDEKNRFGIIDGKGVLRKKSPGWYGRIRGGLENAEDEMGQCEDSEHVDDEDRISGNWI